MIRRASILIALVVVGVATGSMQRSHAQPPAAPGVQALDEAAGLEKRVAQLHGAGKFREAIPLAEQCLALREKALGPHHLDVATSLNWLGLLDRMQGAYGKAEPLFARALEIRENALGAMHPDVAESLNNLGELYRTQGAYGKAEPLFVRALDIREKALGAMHPDVANVLENLAALYWKQGLYEKAKQLYVRALDIREKALGAMHPDVGETLNDLAIIYEAQGAYGRAEPLFVRALDIFEKGRGAMHPDVATCLDNLAVLYWALGAYGKAEPLYVRALDIREKVLGANHPDMAQSLNNLADLYRAQGAYGRAEPLLVRALDIREKTLGANHPIVAQNLVSLAIVYRGQKAYKKAEPLYVRALEIREKALGAMHPDVAQSLDNLAGIYQVQGLYGKAEPLKLRAADINEKSLGKRSPAFALSLLSLAWCYRAQGLYGKAEPLYVRALEIFEESQGRLHPYVATTLDNLAALYQAQGSHEKAEPLVARMVDIQEDELQRELARLSAPRKRALMMRLQIYTDSVVSLHADSMSASSQALELALTTVLRRKGRILDSLTENQANLLAHLSPALRDTFRQLVDVNSEISTRLRAPLGPRDAVNRTAAIAALRARAEDLESTLNRASAELRIQSERVTLAKIQAALPRNAVLVEFVRYHRSDSRTGQSEQEGRYVAYLLPWRGPPQWVALGEAAPIDAGIDAVLAEMHQAPGADAAKSALQRLDALVFAPIRTRLTGVTHVILSPDDKLNLVPFEALIDEHGHYALENWLMSYVGSGRDLLRLSARRAPRSPATILAAPDYGPPSSPACNGLGSFCLLDGMLAEAQDLPAYLPRAQIWTGKQATKAVLAATVGPSVLHIATHGFFARGAGATSTSSSHAVPSASAASAPPATLPDATRGMSIEDTGVSAFGPLPTFDDPSDALDRAGLALAGANIQPDGIVTARELASYDWWGTQLVVLSACETGVGAVPSGDGVYGLRRALVLAGAEAQVVSLWNVSDSSARDLMRAFYGELARGTGRAEALRQAKLRLLRRKTFAHPYYWAAFIAAGDWTPLDSRVFKGQGHGR